jgi:SpoVK/Ycf46/Vps4 family AAA+-type ATPase
VNILRQWRGAVEGFFADHKAYDTWGFSWRRGVLLIGPPDADKTMICKAIAAALSSAQNGALVLDEEFAPGVLCARQNDAVYSRR